MYWQAIQFIKCQSSVLLFLFVGFLVGKEGPMIHSGAIIGSGIPQVSNSLVPIPLGIGTRLDTIV